jgi:hypothetical protein
MPRRFAIHALDERSNRPLCRWDAMTWSWTTVHATVTCAACRSLLAGYDDAPLEDGHDVPLAAPAR